MNKIYYTIYKVTNKLNGKIYIGSHKTKKLDDEYMGSGKYILRAIEKHGLKNFQKEILYVFETPEEMYKKEAEIVNEEFLETQNTYNLKIGGFGGFDYLNSSGLNYTESQKQASYFKKNGNLVSLIGKNAFYKKLNGPITGPILRDKLSNVKKNKPGGFRDKRHSEETKQKMSLSKKGKFLREENSQYGTMWITDGVISKKIQKDSLIPCGWYAGRKLTSSSIGRASVSETEGLLDRGQPR